MFISRTHLAVKFKKESSITLTEFVIKEKIEEGKRLLRYSDKPISSIADYLEFSSQGISLMSLRNMQNVRLMKIELMISNQFCFIFNKTLGIQEYRRQHCSQTKNSVQFKPTKF